MNKTLLFAPSCTYSFKESSIHKDGMPFLLGQISVVSYDII